MFVDIVCDDNTTQIARIQKEDGDSYTVNFLDKHTTGTYRFSTEDEIVSEV